MSENKKDGATSIPHMRRTCLDLQRNEAYLEAHRLAEFELKVGNIKSFSCSHERDRGRLIYLETDQGWNPDPFFEEFPLDQWPSPPN